MAKRDDLVDSMLGSRRLADSGASDANTEPSGDLKAFTVKIARIGDTGA